MTSTSIRVVPRLLIAVALTVAGSAQAQQQEKKAVLWKDPGNIAALDLLQGKGAPERAPKGPFTFLKEDTGGVQPKIDVRDASGREWDVKFGEEVHAEIAANRLVWALGYVAEEIYFVPNGTITGMTEPGKFKEFVARDGTFSRASFRLRGDESKRAEERWTFEKNPFVDTPELSGLAILMTMLCNWDIQGPRNNRILTVDGEKRLYRLGPRLDVREDGRVPRAEIQVEPRGLQERGVHRESRQRPGRPRLRRIRRNQQGAGGACALVLAPGVPIDR